LQSYRDYHLAQQQQQEQQEEQQEVWGMGKGKRGMLPFYIDSMGALFRLGIHLYNF
jgi:hypothetical protein